MTSLISHVVFNIAFTNAEFYKELLTSLGWSVIHDDGDLLGMQSADEMNLWFARCKGDRVSHHDDIGMNHLGFNAASEAEVDAAVAHLHGMEVELLFGTPCRRPEYEHPGAEVYYSAMFRTPDRILFEIAYVGPETG